jgi:endonuclease YncB( thermonuclease family)
MFQKLKSIYTQNKILGIICYILAVVISFYAIFFVAGYFLIKLVWKIKIPTWAKAAILITPIFFLGIVGTAWIGVTTGISKADTTKNIKQSSSSSNSSQSATTAESGTKDARVSTITIASTLPQSSQIETISSPEYIKLEQGKTIDSDGTKVEFVNEIKEVEKAINTVPAGEYVKILDVIDGDTVKVEKYGTLRLIGIDTPETKDPRKVIQCFGKEASQNAHNKLDGQKVKLEFNPADRIDKYNRVLAYITTEAGYDYNYNAILEGYANAYVKFPHPRSESYLAAQKSARENQVGLWSADTCSGDTTQPSKENTKTKVEIPPIIPVPGIVATPKVETPKPQIVEQPKTQDQPQSQVGIIRKSNNKRCHSPASPNYDTMTVTGTYSTFEECEASAPGVKRYK